MGTKRSVVRKALALLFGAILVSAGLAACSSAESPNNDDASSKSSNAPSSTGSTPEEAIPLKWWLIPGTSQEWIPEYLDSSGLADKYGFDIELVKQTSS